MFKKIVTNKLLHLLFPAVVIGIILPFCFKKDLVIFPGKPDMELNSYTDIADSLEDGRTTIDAFKIDSSSILFEYTIGRTNTFRFAGFQWFAKPPRPFLNIRDYDHLYVSFDQGTTEEAVIMILQLFTDGFSRLDDPITWRFFCKELSINEKRKTFSIPLKEFKTPLWWFNQYKISETDLNQPDFSKLGMISIQEGSDTKGHHRVIVLKELRFQKMNSLSLAFTLIGLLLFYYLCYGISVWVYSLMKTKKSPLAIPYQKLDIEDDAANEDRKVLEYLGNNFSNQALSLSRMSSEIGISSIKISAIIKRIYDLTFRQYLNTIRIAEAKRLLQETRLQISQIAYRVGYTNLTHFCRTFKEVSSVSPNTFRQEILESDEQEEGTGLTKAEAKGQDHQ